jgi:hypothetical protein
VRGHYQTACLIKRAAVTSKFLLPLTVYKNGTQHQSMANVKIPIFHEKIISNKQQKKMTK